MALPRVKTLGGDRIIVIEVCINCQTHQWNTRHDASKYASFAHQTAGIIQEQSPGTTVLFNQIPKIWYQQELYCQLIPCEDDEVEVYDMVPRLGAFEVSSVLTTSQGGKEDILLFTKIISGLWPAIQDLGLKVGAYFEEIQQCSDLSTIKPRFQTTGKGRRRKRTERPSSSLSQRTFVGAETTPPIESKPVDVQEEEPKEIQIPDEIAVNLPETQVKQEQALNEVDVNKAAEVEEQPPVMGTLAETGENLPLNDEEVDPNIDLPPVYVRKVERKKTLRERQEQKFLKEAKEIFNKADLDRMGFLSIIEARKLAQDMHKKHGTEYDEDEFQEYFKATDLNSDNRLSWEEWSKKALEQAVDGMYFDSSEEENEEDGDEQQ